MSTSAKKQKLKEEEHLSLPGPMSEKLQSLKHKQPKGRRNIRSVWLEEDLNEQTKKTAKEEEERKKRLAERQMFFNQNFVSQAPSKLILDYNLETKKELVCVNQKLVKELKPHQMNGVQFMWNACFESLEELEKGRGSGCILAHCMGLGKSLQIITLVHTLLRLEKPNMRTVLILAPVNTILNWITEFRKWLKNVETHEFIAIYELTKCKQNERVDRLKCWTKSGGIMILGYEMFRSLLNNGKKLKSNEDIESTLLRPGPDLVICDEGHVLKNENSAITKTLMQIETQRRIVLTGTPLQNNLMEYFCMTNFVKPYLLGTKEEFVNRFFLPIENGLFQDSRNEDVILMNQRSYVLHRVLDETVQRCDYSVLRPFLPPKHEFVLLVALSDLQAGLYKYYIENESQVAVKNNNKNLSLFRDFQTMRLLWTHPLTLKLSADRKNSKSNEDTGSDSATDIIDSDAEDNFSNLDSGSSRKELDISLETMRDEFSEQKWWHNFVSNDDLTDYKNGPKLTLLFEILKYCQLTKEKILIFSQSLPTLDMIEYFLNEVVGEYFVGRWEKGKDYFRLDGQTRTDARAEYCQKFNDVKNPRARLFLISTRAGGMGINLTAASRVVLFDVSWNPSHDVQSIFRIYRFGQTKPCYIYRFVSQGTMEEKMYDRQVTKLSVSLRVVDEEQIDRHFTREEVGDLYAFTRAEPSSEVPKLPNDILMAKLLKEHGNVIISYHEHDSLLVNTEEDDLTEEERKVAWASYEKEMNPMAIFADGIHGRVVGEDEELKFSDSDEKEIVSVIKKINPKLRKTGIEEIMEDLHKKLMEFSMNEKKNSLLSASQDNSTGTSLNEENDDSLDSFGGNGSSSANNQKLKFGRTNELKIRIVRPFCKNQKRPLFSLNLDVTACSEEVIIKGYALLHLLQHELTYPATFDHFKGKTDPLNTPCTWMFKWESPLKRPEDIISVFKSELHWKTKPQFIVVGKNVLAFMNFCVRRITLERGLAKHGIEMSYVKPDLKAAEHILGIRLEVDDPAPVGSEGHNDANAQSSDVISSSELKTVIVSENAGNDVSHSASNVIVSYSGNVEPAMLDDYSYSDQQLSNPDNEEIVVVEGYYNSDDNLPLSQNEDAEIVVVSLDDFADDE